MDKNITPQYCHLRSVLIEDLDEIRLIRVKYLLHFLRFQPNTMLEWPNVMFFA